MTQTDLIRKLGFTILHGRATKEITSSGEEKEIVEQLNLAHIRYCFEEVKTPCEENYLIIATDDVSCPPQIVEILQEINLECVTSIYINVIVSPTKLQSFIETMKVLKERKLIVAYACEPKFTNGPDALQFV
jgi:hypothetical protein